MTFAINLKSILHQNQEEITPRIQFVANNSCYWLLSISRRHQADITLQINRWDAEMDLHFGTRSISKYTVRVDEVSEEYVRSA